MDKAHLSLEALARLLAGDFDSEELNNQVLPHLMAHCPTCREKYEEIRRLQLEFGHWDERVAVFEGQQAPELFAHLKERPFDEQLSIVADDTEFQNWALCHLLLKKSLEAGNDDPSAAANYAELALRITGHLDEAYDPHWVRDIRARAHAHVGNARRIMGELRSAEAAFREAEACLATSLTGNEEVRIEILDLKASLRREQRRFSEALQLWEEATSFYREAANAHRLGIVLLKRAKALEDSGDLESAIQELKEAGSLLTPEQDFRLFLYSRHNLLSCLVAAGYVEEAQQLLPEVRELSERLDPTRINILRLKWIESRIALRVGRLEEAESGFRQVQREFLSRGMGFDAALVSLDLAILYIREHRHEEIKRLAFEIMPVFQSRDVHRESIAALIMFQKACEEKRLTVELAGQIAASLQRSRN